MSMTEAQVRSEWSQSGIGRGPTSAEIDNWTRHGSPGQLVRELGRGGGGSDGGGSSQSLGDLVGGAVDQHTGQQLVGWRHPETGAISTDPGSGFGEGSIPLWGGRDNGSINRYLADEGARVYDEGLRGHGHGSIISIPTADWDNKADNPWVKNISSGEGDRFHMIRKADGTPEVFNGRYMWEQRRHQGGGLTGAIDKAFGTNINHFLNESLPSDLAGAIAFIQGPTAGIVSGSEWSAGGTHTFANATGTRDEEVSGYSDAIGTTVAFVAGTILGGPPGGAAAAAGYQAILGAEQHITNDSDFDWGNWAEESAINIATSSLGGGMISMIAQAGVGLARGEDWQDIAEDAVWSSATRYAGQSAPGGALSTAGLTRSSGVTAIRMGLEDDPQEQASIAIGAVTNQVLDGYSEKGNLSEKLKENAS